MREGDRLIRLKCPRCRAASSRAGFFARGQFCSCGWSRSESEEVESVSESEPGHLTEAALDVVLGRRDA